MRNLLLGQVSVLIAVVLTVASLAPQSGAAPVAQEPEAVLYSFCAQKDCADGAGPEAGLIMDAAGHLYGTTETGGAHGNVTVNIGGTVFELTPNAAKAKWIETVLYGFCALPDCKGPQAGLIKDAAGHLYGTTGGGGAHDGGTAFALTPNAAKSKWTETVLYSLTIRAPPRSSHPHAKDHGLCEGRRLASNAGQSPSLSGRTDGTDHRDFFGHRGARLGCAGRSHEAFLTVAVGLMRGAMVLAAAPPVRICMGAGAGFGSNPGESSLKAFLAKARPELEQIPIRLSCHREPTGPARSGRLDA